LDKRDKRLRDILTACVKGMNFDAVFTHSGKFDNGKKMPEKKNIGARISVKK